ncbi:hypothetical protein OBBRIDRAFT_530088 [Obba rivulosa]|uniref:polynucleotide adenylyltransferase n=1 Tax=Obba rivulosa TaxID=1052685 RepID=A0A8E2AVX9_9APHY|nr:hypothetical protein OBBRIDRAFT_530088 [Obba rivulosa]
MATAYAQAGPSTLHPLHQHYLQPSSPPQARRPTSKQRFIAEFSQCLIDFVVQLLPTQEELAVKEDVRKLLERLIHTIEPDSRLLSFGSTANGFSLRNSDMDLCCLIDSEERLSASDLVTMLGDLLERETKFHVKPLPHARIPIVKLTLDPSPENTRLLMCYAMIDPARVRTMVLFLKVWSKRRKINSPYKGTLSSYGYVLLVIYFLVHVKSPPVLPNLQQMSPLRPISYEDTHLNGHNIWFFDDIELLRQKWKSSNTETVAELLIDFFKFYSREFAYNSGVASIRAGLLKKDSKGWQSELHERGTPRERNRLCIEDPFETDFNVARCVTRDGLYTIRGEFMRALRILSARPERAIVALAQLCEERKEEELSQPSPSTRPTFVPPRLAPLPPQTPYTVGSSPMRPARISVPVSITDPTSDRLSPSQSLPRTPPSPLSPSLGTGTSSAAAPSSIATSPSLSRASSVNVRPPMRLPLDKLHNHMAPIRAKWTSPPPPDASPTDHSAFEHRLGQVLALATAAGDARQQQRTRYSPGSSANSERSDDEVLTQSDIAESDDAHSVRSYTEDGGWARYRDRGRLQRLGSAGAMVGTEHPYQVQYRQQHHSYQPLTPVEPFTAPMVSYVPAVAQDPSSSRMGRSDVLDARMLARLRGRPAARLAQQANAIGPIPAVLPANERERFAAPTPPPRMDTPRRSMSGPARTTLHLGMQSFALGSAADGYQEPQGNVFYEATPRHREGNGAGMYSSPQALYQQHYEHSIPNTPSIPYCAGRESSDSRSRSRESRLPSMPIRRAIRVADLPDGLENTSITHGHAHTLSTATVTAPTPPASNRPLTVNDEVPRSRSRSWSRPHSPSKPTDTASHHDTALDTPQHHSQPQSQPHSHSHRHSHSPQPTSSDYHPQSQPPSPPSQERQHSQEQSDDAESCGAHIQPCSHVHQPAPALSDARRLRNASPGATYSSASASPEPSCGSSHYAASSSPLSTSPSSPAQAHAKPVDVLLVVERQDNYTSNGRDETLHDASSNAEAGDGDHGNEEGKLTATSESPAPANEAAENSYTDAPAASVDGLTQGP